MSHGKKRQWCAHFSQTLKITLTQSLLKDVMLGVYELNNSATTTSDFSSALEKFTGIEIYFCVGQSTLTVATILN